jgi:hypothetical protein
MGGYDGEMDRGHDMSVRLPVRLPCCCWLIWPLADRRDRVSGE